MTITNRGSSTATDLHARAIMPAYGLEYVPGYAKLYYVDSTGAEKVMPVVDSLNGTGNGIVLPDLPAAHWFYLTYKVRISSAAVPATYAADNQVVGAGISLSSNNGLIAVDTNMNTSVTLSSGLYNFTNGDKAYTQSINAKPGDEIIYRMVITNRGSSTATDLHARVIMPSAGLEYVPGYAKLYYVDSTGADKVIPVVDALNGVSNGIVLPNLPAGHWFYLTYKAKVSVSANAGTYAADNQVVGAGISLSDNNGLVSVNGGIHIPSDQKNLFVNATAYNSTQAKAIGFNNSVSANRGDVIKFHVDFADVGNTQLKNIKLTNVLPSNMEFVAGSMKVVLSGNIVASSDSSFSSGVSLGDLSVGATGYYEFQAKIKSNTPSNIVQLTYSANGIADGIAGVSSTVNINLGIVATTPGTTNGNAADKLPETGTAATTILALILLATFVSIASYIYMKESGSLDKALKVINK